MTVPLYGLEFAGEPLKKRLLMPNPVLWSDAVYDVSDTLLVAPFARV
jgi:hypothetical protein